MASKGDGIETRIKSALEWARAEAHRCEEIGLDTAEGAPRQFAYAARAAGFTAAIEILEEVLDPGRHSRG